MELAPALIGTRGNGPADTLAAVLPKFMSSLERAPSGDLELFESIQEVILVVSSSRSGSSVFDEMLWLSGSFARLPGEINPLLRLMRLTWPWKESDALDAADGTPSAVARLRRIIASEVEFPGAQDEVRFTDTHFSERLFRRLLLQWPCENIAKEEVIEASVEAAERVTGSPFRDVFPHHHIFLVHLLSRLRGCHPSLNPYYYDLSPKLVASIAPDISVPMGPPGPVVIEEPPFISLQPRHNAGHSRRAMATPLVIKAPSNAYRLNFLTRLFGSARIRFIHLTRNPAASINGLRDGWRFHGFHSNFVGSCLRPSAVNRGDQGWWKFDLPPGWQAVAGASLEQICGFQWMAAQRTISEALESGRQNVFRVRFEDVITNFSNCPDQLSALRTWLATDEFANSMVQSLPPVMMTHPPRPGRWRANAAVLRDVLSDASLQQAAARLGYADQALWI